MSQRTFDAPDLESALARVHDELGPGARIVNVERVRDGGFAGFFCRQRFEVTVEGDGPGAVPGPEPAPSSLLDLADRVAAQERAAVSTEGRSFAAVLGRISAEAGEAPPPPPTAPSPAARLAPAAVDADVDVAAPVTVAGGIVTIPAPAAPPVEVIALDRLGLPPALVPESRPGEDVWATMARALERLPLAPAVPDGGPHVVAVVGPHAAALAVARDLAADAGLDPGSVALAGATGRGAVPAWLHVADARTAADRSATWRRRGRPAIVAVEAGTTAGDAVAARHLLEAMAPDAVWGVVDATRKTEDVAAWVSAVGGVDALAVDGVESTTSPASVLHLGIPVGRLDGRRATAARWAALLAERLAA